MSSTRGIVANAVYEDSIDSEKFIMFLKRIQKAYGDDPFVIYMDSLSAHISEVSSDYMQKNGLQCIFAPRYSPEY